MHEDELHRQIAELVADNADLATPPSIAAIRRRGRVRRARLASGTVLLIAAAAVVGLVAVQGSLGRQVNPAPVVTQPPRPVQPSSSFADYVRGRFDDMLVDMTVVVLASGKAGGDDWQLAAVRGTSRSHKARVCLVHKTDGQSHNYGYSCLDEASTQVADRMTSGGGPNEQTLWGLVPERTARVRLLRPGALPVEVPAMEIGPRFQRRYYLAPWTPSVQTELALDAQGHEIARFPPGP
jgi:hypothetical protein